MQFSGFLHKNCIPIRQKFVRNRLQIRSFQEVKIFKYTYCEKDGSRTDTKSRMEHFVLVINGWKLSIIVKKISI